MTPRQTAFVEHFKLHGNATQAAIQAGYSEKTAKEQGSRLLRNTEIAEAIRLGQMEIKKENLIKVSELIADVLKINSADIRKLFDANGKLKKITELDDATAYAISEYSETKGRGGTTRRVKMYNKLTALDTLFKLSGEYVSKLSILQSLDDDSLAELVEKMMKGNEK